MLCDWAGAVLQLFHRQEKVEDCIQWDFFHGWGISDEVFWAKLEQTPNFWLNIEMYPWAMDMYNKFTKVYDVYICSSPSRDPNCWAQKIEWLAQNMKIKSSRVILTNHKYLLAKENTTLIDDSINNIIKFQEHGGQGILFEQPWNHYNIEKYRANHIIYRKGQDGQWGDPKFVSGA